MCDCIKQVEELARDQFLNGKRENEVFQRSVFVDGSFTFSKTGGYTGISSFSTVKIEYDQNCKSGNVQHKNKEINVYHTFCPYCGEKYQS